jgi:hypothetical protein
MLHLFQIRLLFHSIGVSGSQITEIILKAFVIGGQSLSTTLNLRQSRLSGSELHAQLSITFFQLCHSSTLLDLRKLFSYLGLCQMQCLKRQNTILASTANQERISAPCLHVPGNSAKSYHPQKHLRCQPKRQHLHEEHLIKATAKIRKLFSNTNKCTKDLPINLW